MSLNGVNWNSERSKLSVRFWDVEKKDLSIWIIIFPIDSFASIIDFQLIPTNDDAGNIWWLQKDYFQVKDEIKTILIPLTSSQKHHHFNWPHVAPDLKRPVAQSDKKNCKRFIQIFPIVMCGKPREN